MLNARPFRWWWWAYLIPLSCFVSVGITWSPLVLVSSLFFCFLPLLLIFVGRNQQGLGRSWEEKRAVATAATTLSVNYVLAAAFHFTQVLLPHHAKSNVLQCGFKRSPFLTKLPTLSQNSLIRMILNKLFLRWIHLYLCTFWPCLLTKM